MGKKVDQRSILTRFSKSDDKALLGWMEAFSKDSSQGNLMRAALYLVSGIPLPDSLRYILPDLPGAVALLKPPIDPTVERLFDEIVSIQRFMAADRQVDRELREKELETDRAFKQAVVMAIEHAPMIPPDNSKKANGQRSAYH
jgi:hypothetical protein